MDYCEIITSHREVSEYDCSKCDVFQERAAIIEFEGLILNRETAEQYARFYCCVGCSGAFGVDLYELSAFAMRHRKLALSNG